MNTAHSTTIDPKIDPSLRDLYYHIKDLRMSERQKEKHGDASFLMPDTWNAIREHLTELFTSGCADVELCSWLIEATVHVEGFSGLEKAFNFTRTLVENHGTNLTSIETVTDMPQYWITPISELNGEIGDGSLVQPLRLCSLVPQGRYGEFSLWHYQSCAGERGSDEFRKLSQAFSDVNCSAIHALREEIRACITAYEAMLARFDEILPAYPAARTNVLTVLQASIGAINDLTSHRDISLPAECLPDSIQQPCLAETHNVADFPNLNLTDREHAFRILGDVACFFRRHEPQSPLAPALETLIRRGRMPFDALLQELLPDDEACRVILVSAGIQPESFADQ